MIRSACLPKDRGIEGIRFFFEALRMASFKTIGIVNAPNLRKGGAGLRASFFRGSFSDVMLSPNNRVFASQVSYEIC